jgi:hypothetical protein
MLSSKREGCQQGSQYVRDVRHPFPQRGRGRKLTMLIES